MVSGWWIDLWYLMNWLIIHQIINWRAEQNCHWHSSDHILLFFFLTLRPNKRAHTLKLTALLCTMLIVLCKKIDYSVSTLTCACQTRLSRILSSEGQPLWRSHHSCQVQTCYDVDWWMKLGIIWNRNHIDFLACSTAKSHSDFILPHKQ